jgi:LDH2 family malate/lactate/ureidoglycolate dehydrogenase
MPGYPGSEDERQIPASDLQTVVEAIFARCGMSAADAALLAGSLIAADLRGVHSHGVLRVPEYVDKLTTGGVDPTGRPRVVVDHGAALVIDGGNSMGQIGAHFAMRQAIERARTANVVVAAVRGSNHCGAMAPYAMLALDEGMIGLATSHTLPVMAPWGSIDRILGISPLAIAIPAATETPLVLDLAFSASAVGKIKVFGQKGLPIPPDWAYDEAGFPTTDPAVALTGLLQPIGGYKGTGLALAFGVMAALLAGGLYGTELGNIHDGPVPGGDSHLLLALRVAAFEDLDRFRARVDGIIRQVRQGRPAPGVTRIYSPGELEAETEARYRRDGIPLNAVTLAGIVEAAERLGVAADPLRA